jgi:hypothetical protein
VALYGKGRKEMPGCNILGNVQQTIVVILAVVHVARQVTVVNPHVGGRLDADGVAVLGQDLGDLHVSDDDVADTLDVEADTLEGWWLISPSGLLMPAQEGGNLQLPDSP